MDAVRTAGSTCVAVLDVQQAGSGVGVQSYRFVPSSWYMGRTMHYATGRQFSEFMSKILTRSCRIVMAIVMNTTCACLMAGETGEDSGLLRRDAVSLGEWFPTFRRLSSWTD